MEQMAINVNPFREYENKFITYVAAVLSESARVQDFYIRPSFLNTYVRFDDIIVKIWFKNKLDPYIYLCELKDRNQKINFGDGNIHHYKQSIEEIMLKQPDNDWIRDVPTGNIYFCFFSNTFVTGDILDNTDPIPILHAICESSSFLGSKNCYKFKQQHQNICHENFYFYLNQPNNFEIENEIEKHCGSDFSKRMAQDIIKFIERYLFSCTTSYLTKKVFNTEILRIYLYDIILTPTMMTNTSPKYARLWNKLTTNHSITWVKNARNIEYNIFGCFSQHINTKFDCAFNWNSCINNDGKLDENFDKRKFVDYCEKNKEKQLFYMVPQTIEILLTEMWKYDELPLILKTMPNMNILHKYKYLEKRFIILGAIKEECDSLRDLYHEKVFIHVGSICNKDLTNELLKEIIVSFQGRKSTSLYNILNDNLKSLEELTCFRLLQLIKERKPCVREKYLERTKQAIYILICGSSVQITQDLNSVKTSSSVIILHCKAEEVENYTKQIKNNHKFRNYTVCCLKTRIEKLEILSGDYVQLRDFLIDQDGNNIYDTGTDLIPIIGKRLLKNEGTYISRTLCRPILKQTIFFLDKGKRVFFLCGDIQSLGWSIKQEIIDCEESRIAKDLKTGNYTLIDVTKESSFETYWKKYSSKGYQLFYVKANNGHLEILRSENCNDLNKHISYNEKYFEENKFFEEITEEISIIRGDAGYGNTSFLRSLMNLCNEENYVILCDLIEYEYDIDKGNKKLFQNPLNYIFDNQESFVSRTFLETIFDYHKDTKKLTIFVDSFEKLSTSKKALKLISAIVKLNVRTIIMATTKSEKQLRDALNILPVLLNPLPESSLLGSNEPLSDEESLITVKNLSGKSELSLLQRARKVLRGFNFVPGKLMSPNVSGESKSSVRSTLPELSRSASQHDFSQNYQKSLSIGAIDTTYYTDDQKSYILEAFQRTKLLEGLIEAHIYPNVCTREKCSHSHSDLVEQDDYAYVSGYSQIDVNVAYEFQRSSGSESLDSESNTGSSITKSNSYSDLDIYCDSESDCLSNNLEYSNSFIESIKTGDQKKINSFITKGIRVNELYGIFSPLHYACKYDQKAVIKFLLRHKADIRFRDICGRTPFHIAVACSSKPDIIQMLLENGSSLSLKDYLNYSVMHYVCYNQDPRIISLVIDLSSALNDKTTEGLTPLHVACQQTNIEVIKTLLQRKSNVNELDYYNRIPLHYCNIKDNKNIYLETNITDVDRNELSARVTEYLLHYGANALQQDKSGNTPLHYACKAGQEKVVYVLVSSHKELVHIQNNNGKTPLHIACQKNRYTIAQYLLSVVSHEYLNVTIHAMDCYLRTPLHLASKNGHNEIVSLLLSMKTELQSKDILGNTALHLACIWGFIHTSNILLENNINIDQNNNRSETALHLAAKNGHEDIVDVLIKNKSNLHCKDNFGNTAMHSAARNGHLNVIKILLKYGMNVNEKNNFSETALHLACKMGRDLIVQTLIFAKAEVCSKDQWGNTPLHKAAQKGHRDVVKLLLRNNASINDTNTNLETALHLVSKTNYNYVIEILLLANGNVNVKDKFGNTPLHLAASRGRLYNVQKLLQFGANLSHKNNGGKTALNLATDKGHYNVIKSLQDKAIYIQK